MDRLLLVGILTDEDIGKLLIMIDPETWDPVFVKGKIKYYYAHTWMESISHRKLYFFFFIFYFIIIFIY